MLNYTWIDDGIYPVEITVEDEERDESVMILNVTVENRAPKIEVRSQRTEAKVEYPITLYAYANDSDSEKVWPGVVDIYWPGANCKEGYYTRVLHHHVNHRGLEDLHGGWNRRRSSHSHGHL